jgi:hypothetical protein
MCARRFGRGFGICKRYRFVLLNLTLGQRLKMYSTSFLLSADEQPNFSLKWNLVIALRAGVCPVSLYRGEGGLQGKKP